MKNYNTSTRLKEIMSERNLRQVDLLELVKPFCQKYNIKINKSDISQYISGKVKPGQEKLSMLGMALDVNETWLMGYDVSKERQYVSQENLSKEQIILITNFNKLNLNGKSKLIEYSNDLVETPKYIEDGTILLPPKKEKQIWEGPGKEHLMPSAAHAKKGNFSEEDYKHDMDIMNDDDFWND